MKYTMLLTILFLMGCEEATFSRGTATNGLNGSKGDAGPKGLQGIQGPVGPKGATGSQGLQGTPGYCGVGSSGAPGKNGEDGNSSLVRFSRQENLSNCDHGSGVVISSGLDENDDNVLDPTEVLNTSYICDGNCRNCNDNDDGCGKSKIYLCHKDCKNKGKTLYLPNSAVQAHLNHGDYLGKCK